MRIQSHRFVFAVAVFAVLATGCASMGHRPGTGDIAFRLYWQGEEDLDLHVQEPSGVAIFFQHRKAESGGGLDVDCNSAPDRICWSPVENVYWPVGKAVDGDYIYWVEVFEHPNGQPQVPFTLQVLQGRKVVHTETGVLTVTVRSSQKYRYSFQRNPELTKRAAPKRTRGSWIRETSSIQRDPSSLPASAAAGGADRNDSRHLRESRTGRRDRNHPSPARKGL
jgi:hypothetical protein